MRRLIRRLLEKLFWFFDDPMTTALLVIVLLVILFSSGCAATGVRSVTGAEVEAPTGFTRYCAEHPSRVECGGDR